LQVFYDKNASIEHRVELGVLHKDTLFNSVQANLFLGTRGAWSQQIPVGDEFTYTKDAEAFLRKLFNDKQRLVDVIETYRAEQNALLDALTNRLIRCI
jgi:hypothetical protein